LRNVVRDLNSGRYKNKIRWDVLKDVRDLSHRREYFYNFIGRAPKTGVHDSRHSLVDNDLADMLIEGVLAANNFD
jgi:hypothetical protein